MKLIEFKDKSESIYADISKITYIETFHDGTKINFAGGNPRVIHLSINEVIDIIRKNDQ